MRSSTVVAIMSCSRSFEKKLATAAAAIVGVAGTAESETPLQQQLDSLGKRLALIASGVVALMFVFGLLRGDPPLSLWR